MNDAPSHELTELTVELLSAFVAHNHVRSNELAALIASTHAALSSLAAPAHAHAAVEVHQPAVTARKSLANPDFIVSLIDGKPYKSLKRHLTGHGLTPADYRSRYKLPATYPMVAASYSGFRREMAKRVGLGRNLKSATEATHISNAETGGSDEPSASRAARPTLQARF